MRTAGQKQFKQSMQSRLRRRRSSGLANIEQVAYIEEEEVEVADLAERWWTVYNEDGTVEDSIYGRGGGSISRAAEVGSSSNTGSKRLKQRRRR